MTHMVNCAKLGREAEGLERQPYPGEMGKRIFDNVSAEAWQMWIQQQTMLINEYRLTPIEPQHRKMLEDEMEKFLFGGDQTAMPEGYIPPTQP